MFSLDRLETKDPPSNSASLCKRNAERLVVFWHRIDIQISTAFALASHLHDIPQRQIVGYLERETGQSMCNTRCRLVSASTPHNHRQRRCGSAIVPGSDLNTCCIADGVVERMCGCCGSYPSTGGRSGFCTAPGNSPHDGGPSEHSKGGWRVAGGGGGVDASGGGGGIAVQKHDDGEKRTATN